MREAVNLKVGSSSLPGSAYAENALPMYPLLLESRGDGVRKGWEDSAQPRIEKSGFRKHVMYCVVWFPRMRVGPFVMPCKHARQHNSATGTRTRVARVRAEYPNQLVYSGFERVRKFTKCKPIARAS